MQEKESVAFNFSSMKTTLVAKKVTRLVTANPVPPVTILYTRKIVNHNLWT